MTWTAEETGFADGHFEVFGQLLDNLGSEIGADDFQISNMGDVARPEPGARRPAVLYDPNARQYFLVWHGDPVVPPVVDNEHDVFGQALSGDGAKTGSTQFQISSTPPDGTQESSAVRPRVAFNSGTCDYFVVWTVGDVDQGEEGEWELFGRRADAPDCPPTVVPDTIAPVITGLRVSPRRILGAPARAALKRRTTFSYRLDEAANVVFTIQRRTRGRRVRGKCRRQTRANRGRPRCARWVTRGRLTQAGVAGSNKRRFNGKLRGRRLKAGRYRVNVVATDAVGNVSATKRARFRVVKPKPTKPRKR